VAKRRGLHHADVHLYGCDQLSHAVVQFACESPALLILHSEQLGRELMQTLVGGIKFSRSFLNPLFKFLTCFVERLPYLTLHEYSCWCRTSE
jgi:hypothetical protein